MGERLTKITATAFRGVPGTLPIVLDHGESLLLLGANGTGKSSISDALEWYFTGRVEHLSREGRGDALRNWFAATRTETTVEVETTGSLGGRATIGAGAPEACREAAEHEIFLLRGHTLAEFIERPKAEKWRTINDLLGLGAVDQLRLDLQRARNDLGRELEDAQNQEKLHAAALTMALEPDATTLSPAGIVEAISRKCAAAGLEAPDSWEKAIDPTWHGGATGTTEATTAVRIGVIAAEVRVGGPLSVAAVPVAMDSITQWNEMCEDLNRPDVSYIAMLRSADDVLRRSPRGECPLCGQPVDTDALRANVERLLTELQEASNRFDGAREDVLKQISALNGAEAWRSERRTKAAIAGVQLAAIPASPTAALSHALHSYSPIDAELVKSYTSELQAWDSEAVVILDGAIPAASDPREQIRWDVAKACQQAGVWNGARIRADSARRAWELADGIFQAYQERQGRHLRKILTSISDRVADIYEFLHPDEGIGAASVELWGEKGLEVAVEFHGRRARPPHGVLSESHLNSLAIALFLAMAMTFNNRLAFVVLDDVMSSFDTGHRDRLAELLATKFDDRQLIVLTHDHRFFERMSRIAPSWHREQFTSWSFNEGPRTTAYAPGDLLDAARHCITVDDPVGAAQKGRRSLEELLQEICEALEAPLPFRRGARNDRRDLTELMKGVRRCLRRHAPQMLHDLDESLVLLEGDVAGTFNPEVHVSEGEAALKEVARALDRIEKFDQVWTCVNCRTRIWRQGTPDSARCHCGAKRFPPV